MINVKNSQHRYPANSSVETKADQLESKLFRPYLLRASKDNIPKNQKESTPMIYVNGMSMSADAISSSAQLLADTYGRSVYVVPNDKERSVFHDLANGALSLFSSEQGSKAEPEAVQHVAGVLRSRLNDDSPIHIFAYSQGSLIIKDALWQIHKELTDDKNGNTHSKAQWDHLASRIRFTTAAAATRNFPPGIAVKENWHTGDPIAVVSKSSVAAHTIAGYDDSIPPSIAVHSNQPDRFIPKISKAHSITEYIGNTEHFFLDRISDLSISAQVNTFKSSIARGEYCDRQYHEIIDLLTSAASKDISLAKVNEETFSTQRRAKLFAEEFLANNPTGKIGEFTLPSSYIKKLELASKIVVQKPVEKKSSGWFSSLSNMFSNKR